MGGGGGGRGGGGGGGGGEGGGRAGLLKVNKHFSANSNCLQSRYSTQ